MNGGRTAVMLIDCIAASRCAVPYASVYADGHGSVRPTEHRAAG
jgi:hypothetical protein